MSSHTAKINQICCVDDDKYLSSVGDDGSLIIWSAIDRERIFQIDEKSIEVSIVYRSCSVKKSGLKPRTRFVAHGFIFRF